ncbi:hypothetical protein BD410DRAFT_844633 [Rickenella mellea]|uniref:F-box domain-containing protein n=1 Tax=Rickenella mellea TaxID=50990 RepID=A0A4Y7PNT8_9AGAM|nr:hypothetical protein BD410DRAFT_844633 [Rickenella mellea]
MNITLSELLPRLALAKGLTELSIYTVSIASSDPNLVQLLDSSPDLEVLCLSLHRDGDPALTRSKPIRFRCLRQLFLAFKWSHLAFSCDTSILQVLEFPPDTNCEFTFVNFTPLGALRSLPHNIVSTLLASEITFSPKRYSNECTLRAFRSVVGPAQPAEVIIIESPGVDLRSKRNILESLSGCFSSLPWTCPVCLRLDLSENGGNLRERDWVQFVTCIPTLESLEISITQFSGYKEEQVVQLFLKGLEKERKEPGCPRLRRLVFPTIDGSTLWKRLSVILTRWNKQRKTQGLPSIVATFLGGPVEHVMEFESAD